MTVRNQIRLIVYRIHEKGLEVLLVQPQQQNEYWALVKAEMCLENAQQVYWKDSIEFDSEDEEGVSIRTIAIEGDWHDLPRIRTLIKQDVHFVKDKIKSLIPGIENGTYIAAKEAFKKLLPNEYAALKELKEIILDRNMVKNI